MNLHHLSLRSPTSPKRLSDRQARVLGTMTHPHEHLPPPNSPRLPCFPRTSHYPVRRHRKEARADDVGLSAGSHHIRQFCQRTPTPILHPTGTPRRIVNSRNRQSCLARMSIADRWSRQTRRCQRLVGTTNSQSRRCWAQRKRRSFSDPTDTCLHRVRTSFHFRRHLRRRLPYQPLYPHRPPPPYRRTATYLSSTLFRMLPRRH